VKLFVIGDQETVLGFRFVGVEGTVSVARDDALAALKETVTRKDIGVVLVTEELATKIRDEVEAKLHGSGFPLVLEIPGPSGPRPDRLTIEDVVRRAIGIGI
jgi:V/A-type H+-transporting ATPase subunit F